MTDVIVRTSPLKAGVAGTKQTLVKMQQQVRECLEDPAFRVRRACAAITRGAPGGDRSAEAHAIFDWILRNVVYRRDPSDTDLQQHPWVLLSQIEKGEDAIGDCNNQSTLFAALGHTIRLPIVWIVLGPSSDEYVHVYPAMDLRRGATGFGDDPLGAPSSDKDLLALDTACPEPVFGRHHSAPVRRVFPAMVRGL